MKTQLLFTYLKQHNIAIDENEFDFQFKSHPDYPSLLAISDTLNFFNIPNGAFKISFDAINNLPNRFLGKLKTENGEFFANIEKKHDAFIYTKENTKKRAEITSDGLKAIWSDIVLLAENETTNTSETKNKNKVGRILGATTLGFLIVLFFYHTPSIYLVIFSILAISGLFLAVVALKELFNTKINIVDNLCNIGVNTSCNAVLNSTKWKIFKYISFSDLGIVFFGTQVVALFLFLMLAMVDDYVQIQALLLLGALPFIFLSVYYQKFVEKKWCPICLIIISVIALQLAYVFYFYSINLYSLTLLSIVLYGFVFSFNSLIWSHLKNNFETTKRLKAHEIISNRFKRDYKTFKLLLTSEKHYNLPKTELLFGNKDAKLNISIITSPYCGHCEAPYHILKTLVNKYSSQLRISVFFNINPESKHLLQFVKTLLSIYNNNSDIYNEAMNYWYSTKDNDKWFERYNIECENMLLTDRLLEEQHQWFTANDFNFTPCLFVNGYRYPKGYKIDELPFFINELIEDRTILVETEKL